MRAKTIIASALFLALAACQQAEPPAAADVPQDRLIEPVVAEREMPVAEPSRFDIYAKFPLTADISHLSENQKNMVGLLIDASAIMNDLFWRQAWSDDYQGRLAAIDDDRARRFAALNYGPWDRLADDAPFIKGVGPKPLGANFYPTPR